MIAVFSSGYKQTGMIAVRADKIVCISPYREGYFDGARTSVLVERAGGLTEFQIMEAPEMAYVIWINALKKGDNKDE